MWPYSSSKASRLELKKKIDALDAEISARLQKLEYLLETEFPKIQFLHEEKDGAGAATDVLVWHEHGVDLSWHVCYARMVVGPNGEYPIGPQPVSTCPRDAKARALTISEAFVRAFELRVENAVRSRLKIGRLSWEEEVVLPASAEEEAKIDFVEAESKESAIPPCSFPTCKNQKAKWMRRDSPLGYVASCFTHEWFFRSRRFKLEEPE